MRFSVVIPTLGRTEPLRHCLTSLGSARPLPDEVVVVDGNPSGGSAGVIEDIHRSTGLSIRYLPGEPGLTRQRNLGLRNISGDVVVFVDDDVEFDPNTFSALQRCYADPTIVGATGRVIETSGRAVAGMHSRWRRWLPGGGREGAFTRFGYPRRLTDTSRPRDVEFMYGCFMTARRQAALAVGFDESLPGYGLAEDEDFSYRLSRQGRISYRPDITIIHRNLGFLSQDRRLFSRHVVVNRMYLFRKNFRQTPLARSQFAMLIAVLLLHRILNRDLAGARGIVEGCAEILRRRAWNPSP